ncbi:MAG: VCBS repeat-containing protein [Acidimicrobiia bacterium]|nr:VCBS repeat-containing protein [Acidimicrobiia bacterium]
MPDHDLETYARWVGQQHVPVDPADIRAQASTTDDVALSDLDSVTVEPAGHRQRWLLAAAAVVVVALAAAGIGVATGGSDSEVHVGGPTTPDPVLPNEASPPSTTEASTTPTTLFEGTSVVDLLADPDCAVPLPPIAQVENSPGQQEQLREVTGNERLVTSTQHLGEIGPELDSDGDGEPDHVVRRSRLSDPAVIERGDGSLTFVADDADVGVSTFSVGNEHIGLGDLNGDGRHEFVVSAVPEVGPPAMYVVPGSTPPGTHQVADVGIRIAGHAIAIGDRNGDGVPDLAVLAVDGLLTEDSTTQIISGADVMAVDVGGDARAVEPLVEAPGQLVGVVDLGASAPAMITVDVEVSDDRSERRQVLHIVDEGGTARLVSGPTPTVTSVAGPPPRVIDADDGTYVEFEVSTRGGSSAYLWRLNEPCPQ